MVNKLNSIQKGSKAYWSLFKSFLNNKKIQILSTILQNNVFTTDFKKNVVNQSLPINAL